MSTTARAVTASGLGHAFGLTVAKPIIGWASLSAWLHDLLYDRVEWADYSYVMPAGAFGYAVLTFLAVIFLHESVSPRRWLAWR